MGWLNCDRKSKQLRPEPRLASDIRHRGTGSCIPMGRRRGRGGLRKVLDCFLVLVSTFHIPIHYPGLPPGESSQRQADTLVAPSQQ